MRTAFLACLLAIQIVLGVPLGAIAQVGIDSPLGGIYLGGRGPEPYYSHPHHQVYRPYYDDHDRDRGRHYRHHHDDDDEE